MKKEKKRGEGGGEKKEEDYTIREQRGATKWNDNICDYFFYQTNGKN